MTRAGQHRGDRRAAEDGDAAEQAMILSEHAQPAKQCSGSERPYERDHDERHGRRAECNPLFGPICGALDVDRTDLGSEDHAN